MGDTGGLGLLWYDGDEEGDEEQHLLEQQAMNCKQRREDLKDPDFQIKSRLQIPNPVFSGLILLVPIKHAQLTCSQHVCLFDGC